MRVLHATLGDHSASGHVVHDPHLGIVFCTRYIIVVDGAARLEGMLHNFVHIQDPGNRGMFVSVCLIIST